LKGAASRQGGEGRDGKERIGKGREREEKERKGEGNRREGREGRERGRGRDYSSAPSPH
jgi:hypothetical protein